MSTESLSFSFSLLLCSQEGSVEKPACALPPCQEQGRPLGLLQRQLVSATAEERKLAEMGLIQPGFRCSLSKVPGKEKEKTPPSSVLGS